MRIWNWLILLLLLIFILVILLLLKGCESDTIKFAQTAGSEVGVLVFGDQNGTPKLDAAFKSPNGGDIGVGNFTGPPGQVMAFSLDRAPTLRTTEASGPNPFAWTPQRDTVELRLEDVHEIDAIVHVVVGPYDTPDAVTGISQRQRALEARLRAETTWADERAGLRFRSYEVKDATGIIRDDPPWTRTFACVFVGDFPSEIKPEAGKINIYYVNEVATDWDGTGLNAAEWCEDSGMGIIAMGKETGPDLLAHEMGHALGIEHIHEPPNAPNFDQTNVMYPVSDERAYLTEGQIYRTIVGSGSFLNFALNMFSSTSTRICQTDPQARGLCPSVQKRIWGDGTAWPPN